MKFAHKVAVIGLGMGVHHLQAAISYGAEILAIVDTDEEILKKVGEENGIPEDRRYTDWKKVLTLLVNEVIIATPDQLHREMAIAFLEAGKNIMCEKPLALTREDMTAIIQAAKKSDKKFMVGQICRFTPAFVKAKELIDGGEIGEIYYAESEYAHDYAKILAAGGWRADPVRNGVVGGGCHAVDLLRWYVGDPTEVFAYGTHKLLPLVSYDDATVSIMKFKSGAIGKVFVSTGCKRPYTMRTQIWGTKGTILCDNTSDSMTLWKVKENGVDLADPEIIPVKVNNHNANEEYAAFAETIEKDLSPAMDAVLGARTISVCLSIVESAKTGKPISPDYDF